ncbi:hypothetical protein LZ30DRAFT_178335 [Colletotrichum cereale]|nr:hypothetical protein LZ30DRAFT_178335 [Colletotrichum cereale]
MLSADIRGTSPGPVEATCVYRGSPFRKPSVAPWLTRIGAPAATFDGETRLWGLMCALHAVAPRIHARMWFSLACRQSAIWLNGAIIRVRHPQKIPRLGVNGKSTPTRPPGSGRCKPAWIKLGMGLGITPSERLGDEATEIIRPGWYETRPYRYMV